MDDTFVVLPSQVGHSVTSSFPSFRKLLGWIVSGTLVDEVIDAFCLFRLITLAYDHVPLPIRTELSVTRTGFEAQNLTVL
jgi:hypothetical protein